MLTFAIPFYENVPFLLRAIRSVFEQSSPQWRLLIVDDSREGLPRGLLDPYQGEFFNYVRNSQPLGMAGNWNRCFDLVRTPYVTLLHGDDELGKDYAKNILASFNLWPDAVAVFPRSAVIDELGKPIFSFPDAIKKWFGSVKKVDFEYFGDDGLKRLIQVNAIMCPSLCYSMDRIKDERFSADYRYVLDLEMTARLLAKGQSIVGIPSVDFRYRRHASNTSWKGIKSTEMLEEEAIFYRRLAAIFLEEKKMKLAKIARLRLMMRLKAFYYLLQAPSGFLRKLKLVFGP